MEKGRQRLNWVGESKGDVAGRCQSSKGGCVKRHFAASVAAVVVVVVVLVVVEGGTCR